MSEDKQSIQDKYNFNKDNNSGNNNNSNPIAYVFILIFAVLGIYWLLFKPPPTSCEDQGLVTCTDGTCANTYDDCPLEESVPAPIVKTVTFKTTNLELEKVFITIKQGNEEHLIKTGSNGKATFTLNNRNSL